MPERAPSLRPRVLGALARDLHHSLDEQDWDRAPALAEEAVAAARQQDDHAAIAFSLLALHDSRWRRGTAAARLPVIEEMLAVSVAADDREMVTQARLLRATALLELGDPEALAELETYCGHSHDLGHARARYGATSRRATLSLIAGDLDRARDLAAEAFTLGETIGEVDARGVYETLLWGVRRAGGISAAAPDPEVALASEPWRELPLLQAATHVGNDDLAAASRALGQLDLGRLPRTHDLEMLTFAAEAIAAAGTDDQRTHVYEMLLPYAGLHIVVGGCASYFGAVDHYLGLLARSRGDVDQAGEHFRAAAALHEQLGAAAMARRSRSEAAACRPSMDQSAPAFHRAGDVWTISYGGIEAHLPDTKGLHDLAVLVARPAQSVHAVELHTGHPPQTGADDVLDRRAKESYRRRLDELQSDIDEAEADNDLYRAEKARVERDSLIAQLSAATGLGGRDRRLGDERERARKAVTARIRDAIARIKRVHPRLGAHLHNAVQTGTWCTYAPTKQSSSRP
ncbi:MAG: hypothetical protein GEU74_09590 [Nitriliruptorales bacterium]|nr:hypothetical protein [Nitriliruptorales bacterium]